MLLFVQQLIWLHQNRCGPGAAWLPNLQFRGGRRQETQAKNKLGKSITFPTLHSSLRVNMKQPSLYQRKPD